MTPTAQEPAAIAETRLLHKMHRAATSLLADAAQRDTVPAGSLAELRDFLVAALRHHHESEDHVLWPQLTAVDPTAGVELADLGPEHDALDAALETLAAVPVADRTRLVPATAHVRDLVCKHLDHEEPVLFPALAAHMPDDDWAQFSRAVISSAPPVAPYLNIGFLEQVGTPEELAVVGANLPPEAVELLPAMREQARAVLDSLRATG